MNKKMVFGFVVYVFTLFTGFLAVGSEMATKEECVEKVSQVVQTLRQQGAEEAIKQVNDVKGQYVWKDSYVYIMDLSGTIVAHGPQPKFIGKNLMGLKDPVTMQPWYPALFEKIKAEKDSKGWFAYHWKKPNEEGVFKKDCYYQRAGDLIVFAGVYGEKVQ